MKQVSLSKFAFEGSLMNYLGSFLSSLLSFLILRLLIHELSVETFGLYSLVVATFIFFALALNWGIPYLITRFVSEYVERNQWGKIKTLLLHSYGILLLGFVPLAAAGYPLFARLDGWLHRPDLLSYVPFIFLLSLLRVNLQVSENVLNAFLLRNYVVGCGTVLLSLRLFLFYEILHRSKSLFLLLAVWSATEAVLLAAYLIRICFLLAGKKDPPASSAQLEKGLFAFGLSGYLNNFLYFLLDTRIDLYVIGHFLSQAMVGWYAFASQMTNILYSFSPATVLKSVITPLFARQYARTNSLEEQKFLFRINCKFQAFVLFPVFAISAVLMPSVITLVFRRDYLVSLSPFWILSGLGLVEVVGGPLATFIWIIKRPDIFLKASGVASVFWIVASWVLTQRWGMVGAAIASGSSLILTFLLQCLLLRRVIRVEIPWESLATIGLHASLAGTSVFILKRTVSSLGLVLFWGILGLGIFLCFSFWKKAFDHDERDLLKHAFPIGIWVF